GVNNAVARLAGLVATAALPLAAGLGGVQRLDGAEFAAGYARAMWISAGVCAAGAVVALLTVRDGRATASVTHPSLTHGCTARPSGVAAGGSTLASGA
ncbi:MAG: MFS transporter, partial [Gemmatimonadales bacterium]